LGILSQQSWVRDIKELGKSKTKHLRHPSQRESQKWITATEETERVVPDHIQVITVGDRESDTSGVIFRQRPSNHDYVIRVYQNRPISKSNMKVFEALKKEDEAGRIAMHADNTKNRKGREAILSIRYGEYEIAGRTYWKGQTATATAIIVNEEDVPELKENEEPLRWLLLTSIPLNSIEDVIRVINIYKTRWVIERFHYTLKSG